MSDGLQTGTSRAADFFAGAGGASRGIHDAGFSVEAAVDLDETALQSHVESLPHPVVLHDMNDVDPSVLPEAARDADYHHYSPSCKDFSPAGPQNFDSERARLLWTVTEWVDELRPKVVTVENVPGLLSAGHTADKFIGHGRDGGEQTTLTGETETIPATKGFASIGYEAKYRVLNAADYGVPQRRKRLFFVAVREDVATPTRWFPEPTHAPHEHVSVEEAIGDLVRVEDNPMTAQVREAQQFAGDRPMGSTADPCHTIRAGTPPKLLPQNHEPADHERETREYFAGLEPGANQNSVTECRLRPDTPARTVAGSGGTAQVHYAGPTSPGQVGDENLPRRLTAREVARIQSFPDDHLFVGNKDAQLVQVGNAVPPLLQQRVAEHVRKILRGAA